MAGASPAPASESRQAERLPYNLRRSVPEQFRDLREQPKAEGQTNDDDDEEQSENERDENPVAPGRAPGAGGVTLEEFVVSGIGFKPERKGVADDRDDANGFIDQD